MTFVLVRGQHVWRYVHFFWTKREISVFCMTFFAVHQITFQNVTLFGILGSVQDLAHEFMRDLLELEVADR